LSLSQQACMSVVGTPDYMAPEIILKSGHNFR
jgi:serine/threonine protein kinase